MLRFRVLALSTAFLAGPFLSTARVVQAHDAPQVVSAAWLADHLKDRNLVLLHVGENQC